VYCIAGNFGIIKLANSAKMMYFKFGKLLIGQFSSSPKNDVTTTKQTSW